MKKMLVLLSLMMVVIGGGIWMVNEDGVDSSESEIVVYCAAGLRAPVEELAAQYEKEYGVRVVLNFGGSGQLLSQLQMGSADVYIPADSYYIDQAEKDGLVEERSDLCPQVAGALVAKGNPLGIQTVQDLTGPTIRVAMAERSAAVGLFSHSVLDEADVLGAIEEGRCSKFMTVNEVAAQVDLGSVDAGIVWDSMAKAYSKTEFVKLEVFSSRPKMAGVAVMKKAKQMAESQRLSKYLRSSANARAIFKKHGFGRLADEQSSE